MCRIFASGRLLAGTAAVALIAVAGSARAQDSVPAPASDASVQDAATTSAADDTTGDVIVTAQRRSERLQDVPVSVAAVTGDLIERLGASTISDVVARVPGVSYQAPAGGNAGFPVVNIRGVTLLDFSYTNEGSVAIYADDVYLGNPAFAGLQLFDLDRVEVLRGPQGTLYGRNATGGLVQYVSRGPTDTTQGRVLLQYGSFNDVVLDGAVSGAVNDKVRVRVAGRFNRNDGYQVNQTTGNRLANTRYAIGLRGTIEADVTDRLQVKVIGTYSSAKGNEDGRGFFGTRTLANPAVRCTPDQINASQCYNAAGFRDPNPDPRKPYSDQDELPYSIVAAGVTGRIDWDLGFGDLTSISAYQWGHKTDTLDVDAAPVSAGNLLLNYDVTHKQFSQELRLGGKTGGLTWLVGGYYYTDMRFFTADLLALRTGNYTDQDISSFAGFGQATYALTPSLNLTGGLRYTTDRKTLNALALVANPVPGTRAGTPIFLTDGEINTDKVTWRAAADWHVAPDVLLYASASTGFKSGGYNTAVVTSLAAVGPVAPETITTYEAGVKSQFWDRRVTFNLTGFYSRYKDLQAAVSVPCTATTCTTPLIVQYLNIGKADVYGGEAELQVRPVRDLTLAAGGALNFNELSAPPTVTVAGTPIDGNRLANTPRLTLDGLVSWEPSLGEGAGRLIVGADVTYRSKVFFRPDNTPVAVQDGYALVGARLGWQTPGGVRIEGFATNLFDKEYFVSQTDIGEAAPATWGRVRQFGVRLSDSF